MTDVPQDPRSDENIPDANTSGEDTAGQESAGHDVTGQNPTNEYTPEQVGDSQAYLNAGSDAPAAASGQPYAASATQPLASDQTWTATNTAHTDTKRSNRVGLVAALAVGALVGGAAGGGVTAWAFSANQSSPSSAVTSSNPQNITVNDTQSVNTVTAVAAKASPSVVTISATSKSEAGTGSGVVLSKDGYVLTNTHVVTLDGAIANPTVQVTTSDGHLYDASIVGTDPIADLAVIKLKNATDLMPATFGDSSKLNVGSTAIAIGAPLGLSNTVTDGIVSALNRSISIASSAAPNSGGSGDSTSPKSDSPFDFWQFKNGQGSQTPSATPAAQISLPVIQTDAAINPGNSGGALLDANAKVIGINVAIASAGQTSGGSQSGSIGVGFAIPSNLAQRVANEIIKDGKASHGLLGASVQNVSTTGSDSVVGAAIKEVSPGGAADAAGIKSGDVVTNFNGVPITNATDLTAQVRFLAAGAKADMSYVRGGKTNSVSVTLGTLK